MRLGFGTALVVQLQDHTINIRNELFDHGHVLTQQPFHGGAAAVAEAQPYDFRGCTTKDCELRKVVVFGHDHEAVRAGVEPDLRVGSTGKAEQARLGTAGIEICKSRNEFVRQVVVEQQLHP